MHPDRCVILTAACAEIPGESEPITHLIGFAILVAEREEHGRWSFKLHARAAKESEAELLEWAADLLPYPATVIGWQLSDRLVPALLEAARRAEPAVAHHFTVRLARLFTVPCVDLAIDHGGAGAPPLAQVAVGAGIRLDHLDAEARLSARALSSPEPVRRQTATEAIALWRLWSGRNEPDNPPPGAASFSRR